MIRGFKDNKAEDFFGGKPIKRFSAIRKALERKLTMLDNAVTLDDLRSPAGNQLEKLRGDRQDQYSIRINDQWRICFVWKKDGAYEVEIVDYH